MFRRLQHPADSGQDCTAKIGILYSCTQHRLKCLSKLGLSLACFWTLFWLNHRPRFASLTVCITFFLSLACFFCHKFNAYDFFFRQAIMILLWIYDEVNTNMIDFCMYSTSIWHWWRILHCRYCWRHFIRRPLVNMMNWSLGKSTIGDARTMCGDNFWIRWAHPICHLNSNYIHYFLMILKKTGFKEMSP